MTKKALTKKFITEIVNEVVGEDALDIVFYLKEKSDVSEFTISADLNIEIHTVRNILYRLNSGHLVTYRRKKDRIKGWYISYWTLNLPRIREMDDIIKKKKLIKFKERLEEEERNKGNYYICPNACVRMDFSISMEHDFRCPECGEILKPQDNVRTIEMLKEKIEELNKEIA